VTSWTKAETEARLSVNSTLQVVDDLLRFMSSGQGKPSKQERAIFASAVVFSYGVWESYVEDLAIELTSKVSAAIEPENVPDNVKELLESASTWELSVHPGWRELWVERVKVTAKGEGENYGLNTANVKQVSKLLKIAGVDEIFKSLPEEIVPQHLSSSGQAKTVAAAINELVKLRSEIVHSGAVPRTLRKHHSREWRQFVEDLVTEVDSVCRKRCGALLR